MKVAHLDPAECGALMTRSKRLDVLLRILRWGVLATATCCLRTVRRFGSSPIELGDSTLLRRPRRRSKPNSTLTICEQVEIRLCLTPQIVSFDNVPVTYIRELTDVNGTLYFMTDPGQGSNPLELWKSDGTTSGTVKVKTIRESRGTQEGFRDLTAVGSILYFVADDGIHGEELWRSDGTEAGTRLVRDIRPGEFGSMIGGLTVVGNELMFTATINPNGVNTFDLFRSDGTESGTVQVIVGFDGNIQGSIGDRLLSERAFVGLESISRSGVRETLIATGNSGNAFVGWSGRPLIERYGNQYVFAGEVSNLSAQTEQQGLWLTDGTLAGTTMFADLGTTGLNFGSVDNLVVQGTRIYVASYLNNEMQLWKSDGTSGSTVQVFQQTNLINMPMAFVGSQLLFYALGNESQQFGSRPNNLFKSDGTASGTGPVLSNFAGYVGSAPPLQSGENPVTVNGVSYFLGYQSDSGEELWRSDGTAAGTYMVADLSGIPSNSSSPRFLTRVGGSLFFVTNGVKLHRLTDIENRPPAILTPESTTLSQRPAFSWENVSGAVSYDLWVNNLSTGATAVINQNVSGTTFQPSADLGIGAYRVWLRSKYADGTASAWSPPRNFSIVAAVITQTPAANQNTFRPILRWNALPGATSYEIWIDNRTTGQRKIINQTSLTGLSFTPSSDLPLGNYTFWVRGQSQNGFVAQWSPSTNFSVVGAAMLVSPVLPTFNQRPQFTWNAVPGALSYEIFLRNAATGTTVHNVTGLPSTNWTPPSDLANGNYQWWIRATGVQAIRSIWSAAASVSIGGQTRVLGPVGITNSRTPVISWQAVTGAVRYELWVDRFGGPAKAVYQTQLTTSSFSVSQALAPGNYRIWVRAVNASNAFSPWSVPVDFQVT